MNLKRRFARWAIALSVLNTNVFAQSDTIYVDQWGAQQEATKAQYYRVIQGSESDSVSVHEYFPDHTLHFSGSYTNRQCNMPSGRFVYYTRDGKRESEGTYTKGFRSGCWLFFDDKGKSVMEKKCYNIPGTGYSIIRYFPGTTSIKQEGQFDRHDKKTGCWKEYYAGSGLLHTSHQFIAGIKTGEQLEYYPNGRVKRREMFDGYKLKKGEMFDEDGRKQNYFPAFQFPQPPESLKRYLSLRVACFNSLLKASDLRYRILVLSNGQLGEIDFPDIKDERCKEQIIKELRKMKAWAPAKRENKTIDFQLEALIKYHVPKE